MSNKVEYYNFNRIRSYDALFNFILSGRGFGKTYNAKKMVIKNFLKKGEQFIYCRRYKTELQDIKLFFDDILKSVKDFEELGGFDFGMTLRDGGFRIVFGYEPTYKDDPYICYCLDSDKDEIYIQKGKQMDIMVLTS